MSKSPLRVCTFESRRRDELSRLVERMDGVPTNAPSMREIPLEENPAAFQFADQLISGKIDVTIFMTGVGTDALFGALNEKGLADQAVAALQKCLVVARGPKPFAALSKLGIKTDVRAPEPNTWEDMVGELVRQNVELSGKRVAVQEYGEPSRDLYRWLEERGATVLPVPVYRWALPEDVTPLQQAIRQTIDGQFDILLWTSAQQLNHVLEIAQRMGLRDEWLAAANRCVIGSIGPTASERLRSLGLPADLEPSHPKMAHLARETLEQAPEILQRKASWADRPA